MNLEIENIGRFEIWGEWAPELLMPIRVLLREFECLLPNWCAVAHVAFNPDEDTAACNVDFEYRRIRLSFGAKFFSSTPKEQRAFFLHEMMHGYAHHLYCVAYDLLGDAIDDELALKLARKQLREANEGITSDLTALVLQLTTKTQSQ